jgi:carboxyl-terminal processing protease
MVAFISKNCERIGIMVNSKGRRRLFFMRTFHHTFFITLAAGLVLIAAFLAGYFVRSIQISANDLPILLEAKRLLLQHGYHPLPPDPKLEYGMIRGMLQAYDDPHSTFSEPAQHELTSNNLSGKFGSIGVQIQRDPNGFPILIIIQDSPAVEAGVLEGDRLIQVDDLIITAETNDEIILASLRGEVGTKVKIIVERLPDRQQLSFVIPRAEYRLPSVSGFLSPAEPRLGIIKVNLMAATTPQ